ncbi:MAG: hypothetical protein GY715_05610 [Planctomycetes bacterium]|nr:hypothetical protein [Planctomycetota bacterium]
MRYRRTISILTLVAVTTVVTVGGCASPPRTEYGGYGLDYRSEPEPDVTFESILEGLAEIAMIGLTIWAGHELRDYNDGYHPSYGYGCHRSYGSGRHR